jgi:hypothetical protein
MNCALKKVRLRDKIGIKNTKELAFLGFQAGRQRASLETGALNPMETLHIKAAMAQFVCARRDDLTRIIGRIIQYLDLEKVLRIVQFTE